MKQQLISAFKLIAITTVYLFTRSRTPPNQLKNPAKSIAVLFILRNLQRFLIHNAKLIRGARSQIEILEDDIRLFKAFLRDYAKISDKDGNLEGLIEEIQNVVREGECVIALFTNQEQEIRVSNFVRRALIGPAELVGVAEEVNAVTRKVKGIYDEIRVYCENRRIRAAAIDDSTAATAAEEQIAYLLRYDSK